MSKITALANITFWGSYVSISLSHLYGHQYSIRSIFTTAPPTRNIILSGIFSNVAVLMRLAWNRTTQTTGKQLGVGSFQATLYLKYGSRDCIDSNSAGFFLPCENHSVNSSSIGPHSVAPILYVAD